MFEMTIWPLVLPIHGDIEVLLLVAVAFSPAGTHTLKSCVKPAAYIVERFSSGQEEHCNKERCFLVALVLSELSQEEK